MTNINFTNSINQAQAYTTTAPGSTDSGYAATIGAALPVNFSGRTVSGSASEFTVAGWVRMSGFPAGSAMDIVFTAEDQFCLSINAAGMLVANFGVPGTLASVTSTKGVSDTEWHYIAVAAGIDANTNQFTVKLMLDGINVGTGTVASAATKIQGTCAIGSGHMQFVALTIWSVKLADEQLDVPEFGPPTTESSADTGVVAAFNFATGPAIDVSGQEVAISANSGPSYLPRLSLSPASTLIPDPRDVMTVFGPTFSFMGWVKLPPLSNNPKRLNVISLVQCEHSEIDLIVRESTDNDPTLCNVSLWLGGFVNVPVESYVHVAASRMPNGNGQSMYLWLNGQTGGVGLGYPAGSTPSGSVSFATLYSYPGTNATSAVHGLSIWDRQITDKDVAADMAGADPTGSDGLLAYFALQHDLRNSVSGYEATIQNAELVDIVETASPSNSLMTHLSYDSQNTVESTQVIKFYKSSDYEQLAKSHGLKIDYSADVSTLSNPHQAFLAEIDEKMTGIDLLEEYDRAQLVRNLHIADTLSRAGIKTGLFEVTRDNKDTVVSFHQEDGLIEIYRSDDLDPLAEWLLTIIVDVIAIIGGMFGLATTPGKLADIVKVIAIALPTMKNALIDALHEGQIDKFDAVMAVIREIYSMGLMLTIVKGLVTGSWWSLLFTALSVLGQILAIILTDGLALLIKAYLVVNAFFKLVYDLSQYPSHSVTEDAIPEL